MLEHIELKDELMCHAIPVKVIEILDNDIIHVTVGEGSTILTVSSMLLPEPVNIGDYVIVHAGFAMHKLETTEAEESLRLFRELSEAIGDTPNF